jgi:hypothetical protein
MKIFRHLTYANVGVTLALLFAMSGGALAMSHYVIEKTSQIKPSVIKKLKGHNGAPGPRGVTGPHGPSGPTGPAGSTGPAGAPNPDAATVDKQTVTPLFATAVEGGASVQVFSQQGLTLTFSCLSTDAKLVAAGPLSSEAILEARYNSTEVRESNFGPAQVVIAEGNSSTGVADYATVGGHVVSLNYGTEDGGNGVGGTKCVLTGEAISG